LIMVSISRASIGIDRVSKRVESRRNRDVVDDNPRSASFKGCLYGTSDGTGI
jgi:hypothetical protein